AHIAALRNSRSGVHHARHLRSIHTAELMLGEADYSNDELAVMNGLPTGDNGYTRTTLLALSAMQDLLRTTDIQLLRDEPFAFINANTVGGMSTVEDMYLDLTGDDTNRDNIKYIDTLDCAESTQNVANHYSLKPFMATISTACSSSVNAMLLGARM